MFLEAVFEFIFSWVLELWNGILEKRGHEKVSDKNNKFVKIIAIIILNLIGIIGVILFILLCGAVLFMIERLFNVTIF